MNRISRVGVDLAKNLIQVHGVNSVGATVSNRALSRDNFLIWCAKLPNECFIAIEASSSSHYWARKLVALGFDARIIAAQLVTPYRLQGKSGKNDTNDAAAICEAAGRPQMWFIPIKTTDQQSMLCVHRLREGFKIERTACINRIRGLLAEFGLVYARGTRVLSQALSEIIEDASNELSGLTRRVIGQAKNQWVELDAHILWCNSQILAHLKQDEQVRKAAQLMGVGPITASAIVATVGDFARFKNGAQFGAWLGLTPRQNSSGGKTTLGGITKHGDMYVRMLLIQGARPAVVTAHRRDDPVSKWAHRLREKSGWQKTVVAMANKNARILWAIFTSGKPFDAHHISTHPASPPVSAMSIA